MFDLVRGSLGALPVQGAPSEACVASAVWWTDWIDEAEPEPGEGYWYLVREANECGVGSYGTDSRGSLRTGDEIASCPITNEELCNASGGVWDPVSCGHP